VDVVMVGKRYGVMVCEMQYVLVVMGYGQFGGGALFSMGWTRM
jgi:hypothetical protein